MNEIKDIKALSHELTYHRYMLNQGQVSSLFRDITIPEYMALHRISHAISEKNDGSGRTYLKDIAEELQLTISKASKMMRNLRDKGLVDWSHDGDGSDGTYILITDTGRMLMERQESFLKDYYGRVIEKFGEDNMLTLLRLMKQLEVVMDGELDCKGVESDDI